ncbi:TM0106 family RecB-like putative nuclease [Cereibacter sphaeroides]|uniref:TM0106 family RecB-like putative nuclease n=1 Tax=Cereibacter sphaeroides TaxID=1063 RepID=UPI003FCC8AA0
MRNLGGNILFSATDLMRFMGCAHATTLDLMRMRGEGPEPGEDTEDAALLQKQGDAHEAAHLEKLKSAGKAVLEIPRGDLFADAQATRAALAQGAEVVFQGAFLSGTWGGWSDFLLRVDRPLALGPFSYEVADTKLKRRPHPKHVLQLALYSDLLTEVQGVAPEFAHVELGTGERATLRLADYAHYARAARARLEAFVADPLPTRPVPCADCGLCRWADHCNSVWQAEGTRVRLVTQARLQHARKTGAPAFELRAPEPGKGFDLLPEPQTGDLFYDIEGDPHYEGGLEYLHGVWCDGQFRAFWAHDHAAESKALEELLAFFRARLQAFPNARIYHYAAYEITALRRLTTKYGIGEAFLDRMLRERRFVDLFAVVRGGLIGSERNYSIKSMEAFYGRVREGEVKTAGGSVVAYERWRKTQDQQILDEIEDYNRIDCISTEELRDWLVGIRPAGPWPTLAPDAGPKEAEEDADAQVLRAALAKSGLPDDRQALLFNLGLFHKREAKPAQWAVFDSASKDEDDLLDDLDALAGLEAIGPIEPVKRSFARSYRFPLQETKLRPGKGATVPVFDGPPISVSITDMDRKARQVTVKAGPGKDHLLGDRVNLHPDWPLDPKPIPGALRDVIADQCGPRAYRRSMTCCRAQPPV